MSKLWLLSYGQGYARNSAESANPELWKGLVGLWAPSLGPTGAKLRDISGHGNDGVLTNMDPATDWVIGGNPRKPGYALDFDGTDDYVDVGQPGITGALPRSYLFSFAADVFTASGYDNPMLASRDSVAAGRDMIIGAEDQAISVAFNSHRIITPKSSLVTETWYAVCVVVPDGATSTSDVLVYIDGKEQSLSDEAGSPQTLDTLYPDIWLGGEEGQASWRFDGKIAEVCIYNRALTPNEIQQLYVDPQAPFRQLKRFLVPVAAAVTPVTFIPRAIYF